MEMQRHVAPGWCSQEHSPDAHGFAMTQAFFFRPNIERQRAKNDRKCHEDQTAAVYIANSNANHISIGQMVS